MLVARGAPDCSKIGLDRLLGQALNLTATYEDPSAQIEGMPSRSLQGTLSRM